jgi:beta-xylosidase
MTRPESSSRNSPDRCQPVAFSNPIIPGFSPDPSVVLVDGTFFLVASSFHIFPGIPVYASKDLQNWVHIGASYLSIRVHLRLIDDA